MDWSPIDYKQRPISGSDSNIHSTENVMHVISSFPGVQLKVHLHNELSNNGYKWHKAYEIASVFHADLLGLYDVGNEWIGHSLT